MSPLKLLACPTPLNLHMSPLKLLECLMVTLLGWLIPTAAGLHGHPPYACGRRRDGQLVGSRLRGSLLSSSASQWLAGGQHRGQACGSTWRDSDSSA